MMTLPDIAPDKRMQVRNRGELQHPGACMVCGNGTHPDGYLDLGIFFDYEGAMYLCLTCLTEAGESIGMLSAESVDHLKELGSESAANLLLLTEQLEAANERLNHYDSIFASALSVTGSDSVSDPSADEKPVKQPEVNVEPVKESGEQKSEPVKSGSSTGKRPAVTGTPSSDSIL